MALISTVFDVFLIPSFMTFVAAFQDVRRVRVREKAGVVTREHSSIRDGAMWGVSIVFLKLTFFATFIVMVILDAPWGDHAQGASDSGGDLRTLRLMFRADELTQVLSRLEDDDGSHRLVAIRHLREITPELTAAQRQRVWLAATNRPGTSATAGDAFLTAELVKAALHDATPEMFSSARSSYKNLPAPARTVVLAALAQANSDDSIGALVDSVGDEASIDEEGSTASLPIDELIEHPERAETIVPVVLDLSGPSELVLDGRLLALSYCERGVTLTGELDRHREALLGRWRELRSELEASQGDSGLSWMFAEDYAPRRTEGALLLDLLGCFSDRDVGDELRRATRLRDPRLVWFALRALLRRGDDLPGAAISLAAESTETRLMIYQGLEAQGMLDLFPPDLRTPEKLAEAHMVSWLLFPTELGRPPDEIEHMGTRQADGGVYHLFRFRVDDGRGWMAGISGPYTAERPPGGEVPDITFSDFAPWDDDPLSRMLEILHRWERSR